MTFILSRTLSPTQLNDILSLYAQTDVVSIEQYPGFSLSAGPDLSIFYFLAYEHSKICGYACVQVKKGISASVLFGPVVRGTNEYEAICKGLVSKLARRGILMLRIIPPYMSQQDKASLESTTVLKFETSDNEINWCTLRLNLENPIEDLFKDFSENHRRSIKKAQKLNLTTEKINTPADIDIFTDQYILMYQSRGLPISPTATRQSFQSLSAFFKQHDNGLFLAVQTDQGDIVGGLCICFQGDTAFYYKGYSHPDQRSLPINHLAFYDAMILAKSRGLKYFDFGGYANNVKEGDQLYSINRFKDGFSGELVVYPKTLLIYTIPIVKTFYNFYRRLRKVPA